MISKQSTANPMKCEVIKALHALIHERLFGSGPWLADCDISCVLGNKLEALGLDEPIPDQPGTTRSTAFGREVQLELMMVFMGMWEPHEIPMILEECDLISEGEATEICERLEEEDPEALLRPIVRGAFFQHFQASARVN